ncbi:hypothetical protein V1477_015419, partial [Vespula maculifrons]
MNKKHWRISGLKNKLMNIQASTQRQYGFLDHLRLEKTWPTKLADVEHLMAVTWWPGTRPFHAAVTSRLIPIVHHVCFLKTSFGQSPSAAAAAAAAAAVAAAAAATAAAVATVVAVPSRTSNSRCRCSSNNNGGAIKRIKYFCLDRILCSLLRHSICYDDISKSAPPGARECLFS